MKKIKLLATILRHLADDCDRVADGEEPLYNSNITDKEVDQIIETIAEINDDKLSKDAACRYLNMSRSTFDRRVADGTIPQGKKKAGWKELYWSRRDLDALITHDN